MFLSYRTNSLQAVGAKLHLLSPLYCSGELSLTPDVIYSAAEQVNINNDAAFRGVIYVETGEQLPTNSRQRAFISMVSNFKKNSSHKFGGIESVRGKAWSRI